jgi:ferredoxin-NADP reductase
MNLYYSIYEILTITNLQVGLKENINDFSKHFYICGPPKMTENIQKALKALGAKPDALVFE